MSNEVVKSNAPCSNFKAITPNDSTDLTDEAGTSAMTTRGILVTVAGVVSCHNAAGTAVLIPCAAGVFIPIVTKRILAASTTATGIIALW